MDKEKDKLTKMVELNQNGRLFPSFISANFKKYKLEDVFKIQGEDPCAPKKSSTGELKLEMHKYQQFMTQYLDYRSIYKAVLIFHGLGSPPLH